MKSTMCICLIITLKLERYNDFVGDYIFSVLIESQIVGGPCGVVNVILGMVGVRVIHKVLDAEAPGKEAVRVEHFVKVELVLALNVMQALLAVAAVSFELRVTGQRVLRHERKQICA